jgi:DNA-binding PadR family transcriptional regulator
MSAAPRMRSQVNWAVLGMLVERPSYGYELHQRIARRFPAEVLDPQPSHVYAALDVMERSGFIEALPYADDETPARGRPRQPKIHYRVTPDGARALSGWMAEELRSDPGQIEFVRRVALASGMRRAGLMDELVDAYEDACAREAQALPLPGADGLAARSPDVLVQRLTVAARRTALEGQMAWLRYARKEIGAFERGEESDE